MAVVKCLYCQETFDREKVKCQKIGRRYAHLNCHEPHVDVTTTGYNNLIQYCHKLFGEDAQYGRIGKQLKDYIAQGMTYEGIEEALKYWFEIKKESKEKAQGAIGIVPFIYKEAKEYWKSCTPTRTATITEEIVEIRHKPRKDLLAEILEG